jgi:drug/metabolite transporter (DMT)-like permease
VSYTEVVVISLAATVFFSLSTALKHRSASTLSSSDHGSGTARIARFLGNTLQHHWWLAGILADAAGLALQAWALHAGRVSVVQPILVTAVLTSLVATHLTAGTRISRGEVVWGAVLVAAIAGFLLASGAPTAATSEQADRGVAVLAGILAVAIALVCIVLARQLAHGGRAASIGIAVGTVYACTAVLIKAATNIAADHGLLALLTSWQLPVLVLSGAAGLALAQLAFRAGPLNASLPATATVDPLASVALGVAVYDEQLRGGAVAVTGQVVSLAALAVAAIALSRVAASQPPPARAAGSRD